MKISPVQKFDKLNATQRRTVRRGLEKSWLHEIRPGVVERRSNHYGVDWKGIDWDKCYCQECKGKPDSGLILTDELWKQVAPEDGLMCFDCMELKIGRCLRIDDLKDCPANAPLIALMKRNLVVRKYV